MKTYWPWGWPSLVSAHCNKQRIYQIISLWVLIRDQTHRRVLVVNNLHIILDIGIKYQDILNYIFEIDGTVATTHGYVFYSLASTLSSLQHVKSWHIHTHCGKYSAFQLCLLIDQPKCIKCWFMVVLCFGMTYIYTWQGSTMLREKVDAWRNKDNNYSFFHANWKFFYLIFVPVATLVTQ